MYEPLQYIYMYQFSVNTVHYVPRLQLNDTINYNIFTIHRGFEEFLTLQTAALGQAES